MIHLKYGRQVHFASMCPQKTLLSEELVKELENQQENTNDTLEIEDEKIMLLSLVMVNPWPTQIAESKSLWWMSIFSRKVIYRGQSCTLIIDNGGNVMNEVPQDLINKIDPEITSKGSSRVLGEWWENCSGIEVRSWLYFWKIMQGDYMVQHGSI